MWLNALLFEVWLPDLFYVRYESLAFLHYAAISVEIGLVSHSVIVLTNCMIEGFFGFRLLAFRRT